jgi:SAM-dependent methyltransferase
VSAFFTLYSGLDREGPRTAQDVLWALDTAGTPAKARICDAGCGSGADSATLARARPEATITAIEQAPQLAEEARARLVNVPNATVRQGDMTTPGGPYDLIWCAGALYFLGVTEGLSCWRTSLAPGGSIAFSEPCAPTPHSDAARRFWAEYPALTDLAGIESRARAAGFEPVTHRMIAGQDWVPYYNSLETRITALRADAPDAELADVLDAAEIEIANWRAAPEDIAYALLLVRPA